MTQSKKAVFLSYPSQDAAAARRICEALRAAGIEVWFDQSELRGGDAWDRQIKRQIHECALFIPIISATTQERREGYFRREWRLAVDRTHDMSDRTPFLVPVVIDDTRDQDADVPDSFLSVQWTRLPAGATSPAFAERVANLLSSDQSHWSAHVSAPAGPAPNIGNQREQLGRNRPTSRRKVLTPLLVGAIALLIVGFFILDRFWLSKRISTAAAPAIQAISAAPGAIPEKSIAVLPFTDMSEKKDQEYFADGMAAEVIDLLAKVPGLKVIGRTSSFQFKSQSRDLRTIGAALGAAYLVEGSVRKSGDRLRVTAQLIDAHDGSQHWSSTYDRKSSDVIEVQDAIAANLARALQTTIGSDFEARASAHNSEAYDLYLRGLHAMDELSKEGTDRAAGDFQQVSDIDPSFAPAAVGLGTAYAFKGVEGWMPTHMAFERARAAANRAIKLDPKLGGAHALLARVLMVYDWDWTGAELEAKQALDLGDQVDAIEVAAELAAVRGDWDRATQLIETGLAVDPLSASHYVVRAIDVELRLGQFAKAESSIRRALEISPNYGSGRWFLGLSLLFQNRLDEALAVMQQETIDDGQLEGTAIVYYAMHKNAESDAALKRALVNDGILWPSAIARTYAFRGEKDQAMKWLERAYVAKDEDLYLIKGDPLMRNLEKDPRYKAFLLKMNLSE